MTLLGAASHFSASKVAAIVTQKVAIDATIEIRKGHRVLISFLLYLPILFDVRLSSDTANRSSAFLQRRQRVLRLGFVFQRAGAFETDFFHSADKRR
jgi:hypothetical protein